MDRKGWYLGAKQKFEGVIKREFGFRYSETNRSTEKLPPRLQRKGISIAARVVGREIRNFTKKTTGRDLSNIRESKTRQRVLTRLSELRVAATNGYTKYNLLKVACDHSKNFTISLAPEEIINPEPDSNDFSKNNLHEFIRKYYTDCLQQNQKMVETQDTVEPVMKKTLKRKIQADELKDSAKLHCSCNTPPSEKRNQCSFVGCWQHKGITEDYLTSYYEENFSHFKSDASKYDLNIESKTGWKEFLRNDKCAVFRKMLPNGLFEYRVQASFFDISANHLFTTQLDSEYRKIWDDYIIDLRVVDSHDATSSELVHWVTKCPYPFSTREYIYLRRKKIDEENKALMLYAKATDDTNIPPEKNIQRVETYVSKIIIKPHTTNFDQMGCDFLLTYYDDPKMRLPQRILDVAASKGIADSVVRMHQAALGLKTDDEA